MCKIGNACWNISNSAYVYEEQYEQQFKYIMISFVIFTDAVIIKRTHTYQWNK